LFRENNIEAARINYFDEPFTFEKLEELIGKTGLKPFALLRKADPAFKELGLTNETADEIVVNAMIDHPGLLQRPIVEVGEKAVLARPIEKALEIVRG
jgi:arsenate reductase